MALFEELESQEQPVPHVSLWKTDSLVFQWELGAETASVVVVQGSARRPRVCIACVNI